MRNVRIAAGMMAALLAGSYASAAVQTKEIDYSAEGVILKGYLAFDDAIDGQRPGILVVHEWWGQNEYVRRRARMLAELGYTALAVDMYGNGQHVDHPDEAGQLASEIHQNAEAARGRFLAALALLKKESTVSPEKIAAIGYCFGGGVVLDMARSGVDLRGVVSFHGNLSTGSPAQPGAVHARVLVCHGAADHLVPPQQIEDFQKEMEAAGADYRLIAYEGAEHSFTNSEADHLAKEFGLPVGYNAQADRRAWTDMQTFFREIF